MPEIGNPQIEEHIVERRKRESRYRMAAVVVCSFLCVVVILGGIASSEKTEPLPDYDKKSTAYQLAERIQKFGSRSIDTSGHSKMQGFLRDIISTLRVFTPLQSQEFSSSGRKVTNLQSQGFSSKMTNFQTQLRSEVVDTDGCHLLLATHYDTADVSDYVGTTDSGTAIGVLLSVIYNLEKSISNYESNRKSNCQISVVFLDGSAQGSAGANHLASTLRESALPPTMLVYLSQIGFAGQTFPRLQNAGTNDEYVMLRNIQQSGFSHSNLFSGDEVTDIQFDGFSYSGFAELFTVKWLPLIGHPNPSPIHLKQSDRMTAVDDQVLLSLEGILTKWIAKKTTKVSVITKTIEKGTCTDNGYLSITDSLTCSLTAEFLPFKKQSSQTIPFGCTISGGATIMNTLKTSFTMGTTASVNSPHICIEIPGVVEDSLPNRVWNITEELLSFGTRVGGSGSIGYNKSKDLIYSNFIKAPVKNSWTIHNQSWSEEKGDFTNFYAQSTFGDLRNGHIVLSAHYDSKYFAPPAVFVGAMDSAVSCSALIAWAEHIAAIESNDTSNWSAGAPVITILFFDGEEAFVRWVRNDNTYGSRYMADIWKRQGTLPGLVPGSSLSSVTLFILFDLIGGETQIEGLMRITRDQFAKLSSFDSFISRTPTLYTGKTTHDISPISDDHLPFLRARSDLPLMHLIPPTVSFFPWHNEKDDLEHLSKPVVRKFTLATWRFILALITQPEFV